MSTLRVGNITATGGTGTITVPTGNQISQVDQPAGLVLINDATFTAASSVSMPAGTFTSTYNMYQVILHITAASANANINIRVNNAGTPRTAANYNWQFEFRQSNGFSNGANGGSTSEWNIYSIESASGIYSANMTLYDPLVSDQRTRVTGNVTASTATSFFVSGSFGGFYNVAEANDGLTFLPASGTITGKWMVYGYRE